MPGLWKPEPNETTAYHNDGTHEYFGFASSGTKTSNSSWQIFIIEYDTSYSTMGDPWIIKWPNGNDGPQYVWDDVETYTYKLLGT